MSQIIKRIVYRFGILLMMIIVTLVMTGCGQDNDFSSAQARDMIHKYIFLNEDRFPVNEPKAYQYGSVHVDGTTGGILYRFGSNPEALKWIINRHRLQESLTDTMELWPPDRIDALPSWWQSPSENLSTCFVKHQEFDSGGKMLFIIMFSPEEVFYVVEHYSGIPSI